MAVVAHCKRCGMGSLVREAPTFTVIASCDCALREPACGWEFVEMVPAEQHRGAVDTFLRELVAEARDVCEREGVEDVGGWVGKTILARVSGGQ